MDAPRTRAAHPETTWLSQQHRQTKRLFIKTYGCQMNVYDSERMARCAGAAGLCRRPSAGRRRPRRAQHLPHPREGDREGLFRARPLCARTRSAARAKATGMTIAVAGCVAQAEGEEIMRRAPAVDLVVGPQAYHKLPELIARARAQERRAPRGRFHRRRKSSTRCRRARPTASPPSSPSRKAATSSAPSASCPTRAARNIRGRSPTCSAEARALADQGVREITLLGPERERLSRRSAGCGRCARAVAGAASSRRKIDGLERIRYTTSHPRDMSDDLIALHGDGAQAHAVPAPAGAVGLGPHPQGDEPQARRRASIATSSSACAPRAPTSRSRPTSSSASPARREKDFEATLQLVREVGFASAFSFKYSPRPGTPAAAMLAQVERRGEGRAPGAPAGAARRAAARVQRRADRPRCCRSCSTGEGRKRWPEARPLALSAGRAFRRHRSAQRRHRARAHRRRLAELARRRARATLEAA